MTERNRHAISGPGVGQQSSCKELSGQRKAGRDYWPSLRSGHECLSLVANRSQCSNSRTTMGNPARLRRPGDLSLAWATSSVLSVLSAQALCDGADGLRLCQHMSPPLGVVHQSLDAAYEGSVDAALAGSMVHAPEEIQQTGQTIQLNEAGHKPTQGRTISKTSTLHLHIILHTFCKYCLPLGPTYSNFLDHL